MRLDHLSPFSTLFSKSHSYSKRNFANIIWSLSSFSCCSGVGVGGNGKD